MRNSTMEYKVNQAYEELKRLIQWHPDSEEKFIQKMVCFLLPGQRKCWPEAIDVLRQSCMEMLLYLGFGSGILIKLL